MRRTRLVTSLAVAGVTSLSLIGFAAPAMAYPPSDCTSISSTSLPDGSSGSGTGCGFDSGEQVDAYGHSARVFLGSSIASASGRVTVHFTIPANFPAGTHTLELVGESSGHVVTEGFTVPSGGTGSSSSSSGSSLPFTGGNDIWQLTGAGAALVVAGGALLMVRRRRGHAAAV